MRASKKRLRKPLSKRKPARDFNFLKESNTETKLSRIAIHYEYLFEWGVNFRDRVITISDEITNVTFDIFEAAITEMEAESRKSITVRINSGGGSVYDALAIVGRMRSSPCNIITEGFGCIMSAAFLMLAAGKKRRVSRFANSMHHESHYRVEGRHDNVKGEVLQREREERQWAEALGAFTKKPAAFWLKRGKHVDAYFTPEQLLELGVVDEII